MATNFGKLDFAVSFNRQTAFPLDARSYFESYAAATQAAQGAEEAGSSNTYYYYGQTIAVVENGKATLYIIAPDKTLQEVGSKYDLPIASETALGGIKVGAGLSINAETGVLSATGGGTAEAVDWANVTSKPDDFVFGKTFTHTANTIAGFKEAVVAGKGADTPTVKANGFYNAQLTVGDTTYDILIAANALGIAPILYFFNGNDAWVSRAAQVDGAYTNDIFKITNDVIDKTYLQNILGDNFFTTEEKTKLAGIEAGAQKNPDITGETGKQITVEVNEGKTTYTIKLDDDLSKYNNTTSGFITKAVNDLDNYHNNTQLAADFYNKDEVNNLIGQIKTISFEVVTALPEANQKTNIIYLVPKAAAKTDNVYDEYIWVVTESNPDGKWELIGDTQVDLTGYLKENSSITFDTADARTLPATGEALNAIIGKITKYLTDLADVAFTGSYNNLSDVPTIPQVKTKVVTIVANAENPTVSDSFEGTYLNHEAYIDNGNNKETVLVDFSRNDTTKQFTAALGQSYSSPVHIVVYSIA